MIIKTIIIPYCAKLIHRRLENKPSNQSNVQDPQSTNLKMLKIIQLEFYSQRFKKKKENELLKMFVIHLFILEPKKKKKNNNT